MAPTSRMTRCMATVDVMQPTPPPASTAAVICCDRIGANLGFSRIVVSEIEVPIRLVNLV